MRFAALLVSAGSNTFHQTREPSVNPARSKSRDNAGHRVCCIYDTGEVSELVLFDRFWSKIVVLTVAELVTLDVTDGSTATSSVIAGSVLEAEALAA
jgi:hypothetical protein